MNEWIKSITRDLVPELSAFVVCTLVVFLRSIRGRLQAGKPLVQSLEVQTVNKESSMDKVIPISSEAKVDVKLAAGKLYLVANYDGVDADAALSLGIEVDLLLNKLKEKIPGQIDDAIIEVLKAALKVV